VALVAVVLVHFIGCNGELSMYPSGGPLRFGLPYLLPLLVVARHRWRLRATVFCPTAPGACKCEACGSLIPQPTAGTFA
jgi:hypothetical protein